MAEKTPNETIEDLIDRAILGARRVFLCEAVTTRSAEEIIRKIWYLELTDPGKPITFIINSPGGSVDAGFAIWDQLKMISSPITTLVTGLAASMGSVLSLSAAPGRRFATPNARLMIHQPSLQGEYQAQASDLDIQAREMLRTRARLIEMYVKATGKPPEEITKALDRDKWLTAPEAIEFKLIDRIVANYKEL